MVELLMNVTLTGTACPSVYFFSDCSVGMTFLWFLLNSVAKASIFVTTDDSDCFNRSSFGVNTLSLSSHIFMLSTIELPCRFHVFMFTGIKDICSPDICRSPLPAYHRFSSRTSPNNTQLTIL